MSKNGTVPLVSNSSIDNGVMGFSSLEANNSGNSISCSDTTLGADTMYYQKDDFIGYQHIQHLVSKFLPFNQEIALYIISACRVATSNAGYDYGHKFNRDAMNSTIIHLPQTNDGEIDFDFMESFIREIKEENMCKLSAYLTTTGLSDYTLTESESNALRTIDSLEWREFKVEKLFGKSTRGKRLKSDDRTEGDLPFVTAGEADTGISAFISNEVEVFSKNTTTIDMFGSAKYRNYDYGADDHVAVVHTENLDKFAAIFVTTACHKSAHNGQFNYGHNFYAKDADELNIMLPVRDGAPNYMAMQELICAVQKLVIKDVVLYANKKIASV